MPFVRFALTTVHAVGFDPGHENAFGWATVGLRAGALSVCAASTGARAALEHVAKLISEAPTAIGTDAPLFRVTDDERKADVFVRNAVCAAGKPGDLSWQ